VLGLPAISLSLAITSERRTLSRLAELEVDLEITLVRIVVESGLQPGRLEEGVATLCCFALLPSRACTRKQRIDQRKSAN
jgi:hypothetical protein